MPTRHPRIQVTEDPELARALRSAASRLPPGLSRSAQVRELALIGARHLVGRERTESERRALLEGLAASFEDPGTLIDLDLLRDVKQLTQRTF
jgi:hypothetical protein